MVINFFRNYFQEKHCMMISMVIACDEKIMLKKILVSGKKSSDIDFERFKRYGYK